jgi:DNA (cytosine-5)-methyltransferase 1
MTMPSLRVLDMFSGCGGLSVGLRMSGFHIVAGLDADADAIETFKHTHPGSIGLQVDARSFVDDIDAFLPTDESIDLLVGGPPCQGFCVINPTRSQEDPRNACIQIFLDAVLSLKPNAVLMENVPGLLSLAKGFAYKKICDVLGAAGYSVSAMVLQAAHYGVPQSRWRLFIVGLKGERFAFPEPTHRAMIRPNIAGGRRMTMQLPAADDLFTTLAPAVTVSDAISDLPPIRNGGGKLVTKYRRDAQTEFQRNLRATSDRLSNHQTLRLGAAYMDRIRAIPKPGMCWKDLPEDLIPANIKRSQEKWKCDTATRFGRLRNDGLFTTILTRPEPYWGSFIHPSQHRVISVREAARAQSFPDDMVFHGDLPSQYRQVGNAIPPLLAKALGQSILRHLA